MADTERPTLPPYVPYRTFIGFLDTVRALGIMPSHIDKAVMSSLSGGTQSWLKSSLRYMKLIDAEGVPSPALEKLTFSEGEDRRALMRELFKSSYAFLDGKIDLQNTTPQKLRTAIVDLGAQGDTVEKIVAFLVAMAKDAQIPISTLLTKRLLTPRRPRVKSARKDAVSGAQNGDSAEHDFETEHESSAMKTIKLPKAQGSLTLSGSFNPFDLSGDERTLVYAIIDKMNEFAERQDKGADDE